MARPSVEQAWELYNEARFGEAASMLDQVLRDDSTPVQQKKQVRFALAMNFLGLGNEEQAKQQLAELFELDPDYELPTFVSPSVRNFFNQTRAAYRVIPFIEHTPPRIIDAAKGAALELSIARMRPNYAAKLHYRLPKRTTFEPLDLVLKADDRYGVFLPASLLAARDPYALEYYLNVTDESGAVLVQLRGQNDPFRVAVSVPPPTFSQVATPVYKKWWFWTVIGGAVVLAAGATVAAVLLTQRAPVTPADPPPASQTGDLDVVIRF